MKNIDAKVRIRYRVLGGHVHCRMFSGARADTTLGKNGDLVFRAEEWSSVREKFERGGIEVVAEDEIMRATEEA